ncbi:unnamed protein product [Cercopithifilaria johnstoni]|uniref:Uncharacterized protein n=1 Tax=Cercopithifilaria johnstoni TaxID=2874296 RepID=A0A8J2MAG3_9BILA|nr:unnamed protein product [Cercopithifilaria johnstoni]
MVPFLIIKYFIALTIIIILSIDKTNAQILHGALRSFNGNIAGGNSLNNNANVGRVPAAVQNQAQRPGLLSSGLSAGVGFLAGTLLGSSLSRSNYRSYPRYYPYYVYTPYYYYPYYYYNRG